MEPTESQLWIVQIIKTIGIAVVYSVTTGLTAYKGFTYWVDRQTKRDTDFIDTRVSLLLKTEKQDMERLNKELRDKITTLENNYHKLNEDSLRDMREFMKNFK